ncbi:hypothetical protein M1310_00735 [Candidatus Marsarchaeota archaeon]|nr:hypothetical protein [Candidatus Marsarchaeota archaeon]
MVAVYTHNTTSQYIFNGNLTVDSNEVMFINGNWSKASTAKVGDYLFNPLLNKTVEITSISVSTLKSNHTVYDVLSLPSNDFIADGYLIDRVTSTCNSFAGSTFVYTLSGAAIKVSDLKPGQMILGYNNNTNTIVPVSVTSVYPRPTNNEIIINNGSLIVDGGEQMEINGTMQSASSLKIGDVLYDPLTQQNVVVTALQLKTGKIGTFTLYDVITSPGYSFIGNGYVVT